MPNPTTGGGPFTAWSVVDHLVRAGHETSCVVLHDPVWDLDITGQRFADRAASLEERGVTVAGVESNAGGVRNKAGRATTDRVRRAWRPELVELLPHVVDGPAVAEAVAAQIPDAVFVYHFEALAASTSISAPRFGAVGDPIHLPAWYRLRASLPRPGAIRELAALQGRLRSQPQAMVDLLRDCQASGAFAAHHAAWLAARGATRCRYLRTPLPDPGPQVTAETPGRPRILLLGNLKGIATLDGLEMFARMLPHLERLLGTDGFEARIVGGGPPLPARLRAHLDHPAVRFLGHAEDPSQELVSAHVLLVPTSIPLGIRVRILTGFAYGSCIVTHPANANGIPELVDGRNALMRSTPEALASAIAEALRDPALRAELRGGARQTYDRWFAPPAAAGVIEQTLLDISSRHPVGVSR